MKKPITADEYAAIARLWNDGLTMSAIARRMHRSDAAIRDARDRLGLRDRPPVKVRSLAPAVAGYRPLAPQLGIVAYRDRSGVSLSAGIRTAGRASPPA